MARTGGNGAVADDGRNKRAYKRISLRLGAVARMESGAEVSCSVRDFSAGGMLLFYEQGDSKSMNSLMPVNSEVTIVCRVKQGDVKILNFPGIVVRHSQSGFAIRIKKPGLADLRLLQKVAQIQGRQADQTGGAGIQDQFKAKTASPGSSPGLDKKAVIAECRQIVINGAQAMINRFQGSIGEQFTKARNLPANSLDGPALLDATQRIDSTREAMTSLFIKRINEDLDSGELEDADKQTYPDLSISEGTLSLVDDDSYESWLADTTTIDKVTSEHRQLMYELHVRLSEVFGVKIDRDNNPYRPALFVDSFDAVIKSLALNHKMEMMCHDVFRDILVLQVGEIYRNLNHMMVGKDIVPVIKYQMNKSEESKSKAAFAEQPAPEEEFEVETVETADDVPPLVPPKPAQPKVEPKAKQPVAKPAAEKKPAQPEPKNVSREDMQTILNLVGDLQEMQENLLEQTRQNITDMPADKGQMSDSQHRARQMMARLKNKKQPARAAAAKAPTYKVDDLIKTLGKIGTANVQPVKDTGDGRVSAGRRLMAALEKAGGSANQIGRRERQIINVSDRIFQFVAKDQQVSGQIKEWIDRLEMPILKMALADETLFLDREHQVRQVINKIAQLEMLVEESGRENPQNSMVKNAIEWIVDLVNNEFDSSPDVFDRAIKQLDILLNTQSQVYEQNVSTLMQKLKSKKAALVDDKEISSHDKWEVQEQVRKDWVKKVERIKERDWIVVDDGRGGEDRLRVGYVDKDKQQMALVNLLGQLDHGVTFTEIARELHDGEAKYVGSNNEPALDRAQYTMLEELHHELVEQAAHDHLTGLFDRRELYRRLESDLSTPGTEAGKEPDEILCSVAFIDIDQFRLVNDTCGYEGGDDYILSMSKELGRDLPEHYYLGRMGADEFAMVMPRTALDDAVDLLEERLEQIHSRKYSWKKHSFPRSVSIGLVHVRKAGETAEEVMQEAENSCATAKSMGGNRIMVYHTGNRGLSHKRHVTKWGAELDRIIEQDGLYLRCQRIMPIRGGGMRKNKYEILLGVREMHGEKISDYFLEAAEHYHRMPDIDRWVVQHSLQWMKDNARKLADLEAMSINLSGQSMNDEQFHDWITGILGKVDLPMEKICFEITETAGISNLSAASEFINRVRDCGCRFSLDDFGAGMSSYAYLKQLPVDYLKIDGAFVRDLVNNPNDEAVVKSVCEIGHFMDKRVIAEYVEDARTLKKLQSLKVDYAQGYAVEKPKLLSEL